MALPPQCMQALKSAERFDPERGTWECLPDMLEARDGPAGAVLMGKVYVCGGCSHGGARLSSVERFCPKAGSWECAPS
eukprot:2126324-Amphidinium_carterae.1